MIDVFCALLTADKYTVLEDAVLALLNAAAATTAAELAVAYAFEE